VTSDTPVAVHDSGVLLAPDPSRVIVRFFVPGQEDVGPGDSRAAPVIERVLALSETAVESTMSEITDRFGPRHRNLSSTFEHNAHLVDARLPVGVELSGPRRQLLGAAFTNETSLEGAALCNPSMVLDPVQAGDGSTAFVMSVRAISEGHRSSIGLRTGRIDADGVVTVDPAGPFPRLGTVRAGSHHRSVVQHLLATMEAGHENSEFALGPLPPAFSDPELQLRIDALAADAASRRHTGASITHLQSLLGTSYSVQFPVATELSERVLWPHTPAERSGMEDLRLVRFVEDDGSVIYRGTYTAFDGTDIRQNLLTTKDFRTFLLSPMSGKAATGKGLALFPRRIGGQFVALSRSDRETNSIAFSDELHYWESSSMIQTPEQPWEIVQLGNCGSPIEVDAGWLVLTHGVGPMRTYSLGAILLDRDDPARVLGHSDSPILRPGVHEQNGYVPNVVYSCGAMAVGDRLVLPYGVGDQRIKIATLSIAELIGSMRRT
jgi:predicted GH43/DUF377 family glycosyl hydrolase